jgi:hypothetical protein
LRVAQRALSRSLEPSSNQHDVIGEAHIASEREAGKLFAQLQALGRARRGGGAADVKFEIITSEFTLEDAHSNPSSAIARCSSTSSANRPVGF